MIYTTQSHLLGHRGMNGGIARGMGASSVPAIVTAGGNIAAGVIPSVLVSTGAFAAGSAAIPIIGAGIAAATLAVGLFLNRNAKYFGQEKATTDIVNQAEVLMKQNLAAWQASNQTSVDKAQAEDNFNNIWGQVVQACGNPQFEDPGRRCVADRSRGGQWDWFSYYYDPIHNAATHDETIQQATATGNHIDIANAVGGSISSGIESLFGGSGNVGGGIDWSKLLVPALLFGGALLVVGEL